MKDVDIHNKAREIIRAFSKEVRAELGSALMKLQMGMTLGLPISQPMPEVYPGVAELRFRDRSGIQRVFYFSGSEQSILVFHAFAKKTRETSQTDIELGRKRLKEMLSHG